MKGVNVLKNEHQLKALHDCIETCFHPLTERAVTGFTCETSDKKNLKAHILPASCVADISETEHLLSMKSRSQAAFPCRQCSVQK